MNKLTLLAVSVALACPGSFALQHAEVFAQAADHGQAPVQPSPAEQRIAAARQQIAADAKRPQGYNELALASIRRARETGNPHFFEDAETALATGLHLAPNDFQLQKTAIALLLGRQQFAQALAKAKLLHSQVPDDVTLYGYLAEANIALGNYADADTDAQWMLNLRPNNIPGLLLGAQLRVLYGDTPGALEFLNQAFGETPQIEPEEQASIANRIAEIELAQGQLTEAGQALAQAEKLFPHPAIQTNLARLRMAQGKPLEAIPLLQGQAAHEQGQGSSSTETLFLLAQAQGAAKQPGAAATWSRFEASAKAETGKPANSNLDLILYYAGLAGASPVNTGAALALAQQRAASQHDVDTLDAYAWALYANNRFAEADAEAQKVLAVGVHNAQFDEHAGEIARKLNKGDQAMQSFAAAMQADPASPYAALARRQLGTQPVSSPVVSESILSAAKPTQLVAATEPVISIQLSHDPGGVPTALLIPRPTGTARIVHRMQAQVEAHPKEPGGYSGLGAAFFQRARETGDVEDYQLAEQALTKSLDLVSTDLSATAPLETMAEVCMGEHRFTDALDYAQKALALGSGDLAAFATVGDAYADMGEYEKASIAYSRMQPVTGGNPSGNPSDNSEHAGKTDAREAYAQGARSAYLSFISGDTAGAIRQMQTAIGEGVQAQVIGENLAWLYFELGEFSYQSGNIQQAADAYLTALNVYPGDYRALAGLGKVRAAQGKYAEAIPLYQSAIAVVPMPIYVGELGDIYARTGQTAEAEKQYKLVEYIGLLGHINQVLHNRDLALFYADHDRNLAESLTLARKEFEVRSDIYTWDALAWALYKNGKYAEADEAMSHALRLGTRDPTLLFHAGMISAKVGRDAQAASQLDAAIAINPKFNTLYAEVAAQQLSALRGQSASASSAPATDGKSMHAQ